MSTDAMNTDVIICGAGVGGLACAHALGRLGLSVQVLERQQTPSSVAKGELLQPEAVGILAGWGLLPALHAGGTAAVDRLTIRDPAGVALLSLDYATLPGEFREILCTEYRTVLQVLSDGLTDGAVSDAGGSVVVRRGVIVEDALRDETGRVVGVRCAESGRREELSARLVVAGDGLSSRLRRAAGLSVRRADYDHRLLAVEVAGASVDAEVCAYQTDRGLRLVYPLPGGRCRVYIQVRSDELRGMARADLATWCEQVLAELPALATLADALRSSLHQRQILAVHRLRAPQLTAPGLALVGEAAHAVHPMAAQGMNCSLADAQTLGATVGSALAGSSQEAVDAALGDYHRSRRERLDHIDTVSHNAARMLTTTTGLARRLGRRMMRNTAANPRLLQITTGNMSGVSLRPLSPLDRLYQLGMLADRNAARTPSGGSR